MNTQLSIVEAVELSRKEKLRRAGYVAIDQMVEKLPEQTKRQDLEAASSTIRESLNLGTAAIFEQVLMNLGEAELKAKICVCPPTSVSFNFS